MSTTATKNRKTLVKTLLLNGINNYVQDTKKYKNNLNRCSELSMESEHLSNQTNVFINQIRYFSQVLNLDMLDEFKFEITNRGLTVSFTMVLDCQEFYMFGKEFKFHIGLKRKNFYENYNSYSLKFYVEIDKNNLFEFMFLSTGKILRFGDNHSPLYPKNKTEETENIINRMWDEFGSGDSKGYEKLYNDNFHTKFVKYMFLSYNSEKYDIYSLINFNTYDKADAIKNIAF